MSVQIENTILINLCRYSSIMGTTLTFSANCRSYILPKRIFRLGPGCKKSYSVARSIEKRGSKVLYKNKRVVMKKARIQNSNWLLIIASCFGVSFVLFTPLTEQHKRQNDNFISVKYTKTTGKDSVVIIHTPYRLVSLQVTRTHYLVLSFFPV